MAKKLYFEVGSKTRKAKKGYVSVNDKARKIKKAYVGVDDKARAFWSGGELRYYGTATALNVGRVNIQGVSTSHHALFGGGYNGGRMTTVEAYNTSLTRTTPSALECGGGSDIIGAPAGQYAIFTISDGSHYGGASILSADAYDSSLTRSTINVDKFIQFFSSIPASIQSAAIFSGGCSYEAGSRLEPKRSYSYAVTSGLTITRIDNVETGESPTACSFGTNALYAGGKTRIKGHAPFYTPVKSASAKVFYYNSSLTVGTAPALAAGKAGMASATNGKYALFAGGGTYDTKGSWASSNTVDAYDTSLTRTNPTALSAAGTFYGASLGNYALFASKSNDVNVYDQSLTRTTLRKLSVERTGVASATIGNYALFAGGTISSDTYSNAVDVYTID